jgi:FAD/FMN-containing dehydrogenase
VNAALPDLRAAFSGRLLTDAGEMAPFLTDWRKQWHGAGLAVAQPDRTEDVAAILRWSARTRTPIVPQGGNTGLSGGATPDGSGRAIVLSLARLNRIRACDTLNNTLTVEAGCILQRVQEAAAEAGRVFPLSLAAEGSCTIGGNLATNAGGTAVLRYGNARELCLGLEVVTAQGEIWNGLSGLRKDNTGYDLRDLFIGAEGTLGVITAAVLKLFPAPIARVTALAAVASPSQALRLLDRTQTALGASLTAFELMSDFTVRVARKHFPQLHAPGARDAEWFVLIELSEWQNEARARAALEALLADAYDRELIVDAEIAQSLSQAKAQWSLREHLSEAQALEGKTIKHDISVPISRLAHFVEDGEQALHRHFPDVRPYVFGHLGDGNLHFNVSPPGNDSGANFLSQQQAINTLVHDLVIRHGGSISAEHGLGVLRRDEAERYRSPSATVMMRAIKQALDPDGLMNPGKVLA